MDENDLYEIIIDVVRVYGDENYGLTEQEIVSIVSQYTEAEIRSALQHLWDEEILIRESTNNQFRFNLPERNKNIIDEIKLREDIVEASVKRSDLWIEDEAFRAENSKKILERIAEKSVLFNLAESHTSEENFAAAVFNIAIRLADENPVDLLLEMVEWVVKDINELADTLALDVAGQPANVRKVTRELGFRIKKAERLFQGFFRLDDQVILTIPSVKNMQRRNAKVKLDSQLARERLKERIYGERFINLIEVPENSHRCAIGTDASIGDIAIDHSRGSFIPPTPASLFTAGAAMRVTQNIGENISQQYWDYDIDPREMERYAELEAAENGLFITPNLKSEVITDFEHLCVAAMELRQYTEELRVVNQQANWHPIGKVPELDIPPIISLMFRDGRIFPLVHRIEDYEGASAPDDMLYGTIVRKEIDTFYSVFHHTAGRGQLGATYAGAVKSPAFSWLSMIVFWYIYKTTGDKTFSTTLYRPPLNDQAVSHLLFWNICRENPNLVNVDSRYALTTFQTVRRFSDIAFLGHPVIFYDDMRECYVDEDSESDWIRYIKYHISEVDTSYRNHRRGTPSLGSIEEYHNFIDLCRRASVAMFYATPCRIYAATLNHGSHAILPRWEVALDISQSGFADALEIRLTKLLMWITDKDGLAEDSKHAVSGFENSNSSVPLLIPDVVAEAHEAVTFTRTEMSRQVQDLIYDVIKLIRLNKENQ